MRQCVTYVVIIIINLSAIIANSQLKEFINIQTQQNFTKNALGTTKTSVNIKLLTMLIPSTVSSLDKEESLA